MHLHMALFCPSIIATGDLRQQFIVLCSGDAAARHSQVYEVSQLHKKPECYLIFSFIGKTVALAIFEASLEGFEPTTRCLEGSRSIQLSYRDNETKYSMIGLE
jgi:hypothetical protein